MGRVFLIKPTKKINVCSSKLLFCPKETVVVQLGFVNKIEIPFKLEKISDFSEINCEFNWNLVSEFADLGIILHKVDIVKSKLVVFISSLYREVTLTSSQPFLEGIAYDPDRFKEVKIKNNDIVIL